jgi:sortase A
VERQGVGETAQARVTTTVDLDAADPPAAPIKPATVTRQPMAFWTKVLSQALFILAVGILGLVVFLLVISPIQQNNDQDRLYATFRYQLANSTAPTGGLIDAGAPVALLAIPGLNLSQVVVEGTSAGDLESAPGHRRDTALPGQAGVSLIYGRAVTFGAPFAQIDRLRPGDRISVTTGEGRFTYRVLDVRRPGDPLPAAPGTNAGRLVLETSAGPNILRHSTVVFVDADLLDRPQPTPGGRATVIPPEEQSMASDPTATIPLALWLQGIGLLLGIGTWIRWRLGWPATLLLATPLLIAVTWNCYETIGRLLPNLL